jgi:hypothetical protein
LDADAPSQRIDVDEDEPAALDRPLQSGVTADQARAASP